MRANLLTSFMLLLSILLLVACGGSGGSTPPPIVVQGNGVERIDSVMNDVMSRHSPPGIAVAVVRGGELLVANAYGSADLGGTETLRPDHLFRIASISKPVTGIAALRAIEEGLLNPDAAVFDILSDFLPGTGTDPRIGQITVRHLLQHTSGWTMVAHPDDPLFRSREIAEATGSTMPPGPDAMTRWAALQPLTFDPGTDFRYTNIGYVVLGRVIEQSTGFSYEDFVQQFVFEPAGITQGQLGGITRAERKQNEVEYESFQNSIWTSVFDGSTVVPEPAYGGLNLYGLDASSAWLLSAVDLVRLAAATDGNPSYPDVLLESSFQLMTSIGTPPGTTPLGVAWFLGTDASGAVVKWDHGGGMPGTTAYLARLESGVIIAVVSNTALEQSFFDDMAVGLTNAVNGITVWPDTDLFPLFL